MKTNLTMKPTKEEMKDIWVRKTQMSEERAQDRRMEYPG